MPHLSITRQAGDLVYVSGRLALRPDGSVDGSTIETQTAACISAIEAALSAEALALADVVKCTVWLTRASDFLAFDRIYAERFSEPAPARSTVVSELVVPGALVEIEAIAHRGARVPNPGVVR